MHDLPSGQQLDWRSFEIEKTGANVAHCDCCGSTTNRVWGFVHWGAATIASYFVGWAEQKPEHGAAFDLVLGRWGDGATPEDRFAVSLNYRILEATPQFMVVDARGRLPCGDELAGAALERTEVIGTPLAPQVFAVVDAIYMGDPRWEEVRAWGGS